MIAAVFLSIFAAVTWFGSRYFGLIGLFGAHIFVFYGYFVFAGVAMAAGQYEYDGIVTVIGLVLQAVVLNVLLLPVGVIAMWRFARARDQTDRQGQS